MTQPEVRPLTSDLLQDWLSFFDHEAFSDNADWAGCYCHYYHADRGQSTWKGRTADDNRAESSALVHAGKMAGYLAYLDGKVVGWCQAADRSLIPNIDNDESLTSKEDPEGSIGAIACFVVAQPYRHLGVARSLLERACVGFRQRGLAVAEGYPRAEAASDAANYHGPLQLYLSAGFKVHRQSDDVVIVRLSLS